MSETATITPEKDLAQAREALEQNDLARAAFHAARALADEPTDHTRLELLDDILDSADDPLSVVPLTDESPFFVAGARAHAHARRGHYSEAIDLLLQVVQARPNLDYLEWAVEWLQRPEALGLVDIIRPRLLLKNFIDDLPRLTNKDFGRPTLERLPAFIETVRVTQPQDTMFLFFSASLLRRINHRDQALSAAREAFDLDPCYLSAIAVAMVHNQRSEPDKALEMYRTALSFQPNDVAVRLDIGDILFDNNRLEEAEAAYTEALRLDPKNSWGLPSYHAVRYQRGGDDADLEALKRLAEENLENQRARDLLRRVSPPSAPSPS
jgi:tetratricopeptide (TPR) repeat protein